MIQSFDRRSAGRVTDRQDERSASIPDCAQWAREYFDQYPNTNVEVIVLYQAALAVDTAKDTTQLTHRFVPVFGPKFAAWRDGGASPRRFSINSLVGKIEMNPTRLIMTNGATTMPMPAGYMFQRKRSLTKSQARSLLSIAKLKSARSRHLREISRRTRMDQTCLGWSGFF